MTAIWSSTSKRFKLSWFSAQVISQINKTRVIDIDSVTIHVRNNTGKGNMNPEPTRQAQLRVDILFCMQRL